MTGAVRQYVAELLLVGSAEEATAQAAQTGQTDQHAEQNGQIAVSYTHLTLPTTSRV